MAAAIATMRSARSEEAIIRARDLAGLEIRQLTHKYRLHFQPSWFVINHRATAIQPIKEARRDRASVLPVASQTESPSRITVLRAESQNRKPYNITSQLESTKTRPDFARALTPNDHHSAYYLPRISAAACRRCRQIGIADCNPIDNVTHFASIIYDPITTFFTL